MKAYLKIINIGLKPGLLPWETSLIRKMNFITIISMLNMFLGSLFFFATNQLLLFWVCFASLFILPIVFLINLYHKYIQSIYWYYCISFIFFMFLNLFWGVDSYIFLWYFPLTISMVQLLSKRETLQHLLILCSLTLCFIVSLTFCYKFQLHPLPLDETQVRYLFIFNVILSFTTTIAIIAVISFENNRQEDQIKKMLLEKEVLLAEVFHRVKNNLNIVTSLLNLKKNITDSVEVQTALEECKNRIYSMALVHNNLINNNNNITLDFKEYIKNLVSEIAISLDVEEKVEVILLAENIHLELANSIPCGLILNELITNAYKYAQTENNQLQILIKLHVHNEIVELEVKDNGPGLSEKDLHEHEFEDSLGIELIKSLSEQINGDYNFYNNNGLVFNLKFSSK